ncbi:hypothetical protein KCP75_10590 [Salmonella enterica subsp. enterica]|nr:hypothetical protein KCP75_10590 [Salmonella enterica subsp. enterica]
MQPPTATARAVLIPAHRHPAAECQDRPPLHRPAPAPDAEDSASNSTYIRYASTPSWVVFAGNLPASLPATLPA